MRRRRAGESILRATSITLIRSQKRRVAVPYIPRTRTSQLAVITSVVETREGDKNANWRFACTRTYSNVKWTILTKAFRGFFRRWRLAQSIKQIDAWTTLLMAAWHDACDYGYVKGATCFDWRLCVESTNARIRTCICAPPCIHFFAVRGHLNRTVKPHGALWSIDDSFFFFPISVAVMLEFLNPKSTEKNSNSKM